MVKPLLPSPLFPFASRFLEQDGLRQHYVDEGSGPSVVMVHGNPTWSFYFRSLIDDLRRDFRVVVPDHIGCGLSDKPGDDRYDYTLRQRVDDLERLIDRLHLPPPVHLVLHDWGGMIGMAYATRHPERIGRIVVHNTAAFGLPTGKRLPASLWLCRNMPLGSLLVRGLNLFSRAAVRWCTTRKKLSPDVRAMYLDPYDSWDHRIAVLRFVQDIPLNASDPAFAIVEQVAQSLSLFSQTPILVCWGLRDFVFDRSFLDEWIRRLPHVEVHRFADCGHFLLEDAPGEVAALVRPFLTAADNQAQP